MLLAFYAPQKRRRILTAWAHFWRATPEALGLIFDYLNPIEVKNFQQVCKYFAEIARAKSAHRQHVKNLTSEYLLLKASSLQTYITESMSEPQTRNSHLPTECLARQWVQRVTGFSSEYGGWPASNVTNASNTYPAYGDIRTAWAPSQTQSQLEFLELEYEHRMLVHQIDIYETNCPGAVTKVLLFNEATTSWVVVYEGEPNQHQLPEQSRIFSPQLTKTDFLTNKVRIEMNTLDSTGYFEIDAIQLIGVSYTLRNANPDRAKVPESFTRDFETLYKLILQEQEPSSYTCKIVCPSNEDDSLKTYHVHRAMIKHRCPKLFARMENEELFIQDYASDIVELVLRFIYTDQVVLPQLEHADGEKYFSRLEKFATEIELGPVMSYCQSMEPIVKTSTWLELAGMINSTLEVSLADHMRNMSADEFGADVEFFVQDVPIRRHSFILKIRSTYFNAMLSRWMSDSGSEPIILDDLSLASFSTILEYIYSGSTIVNEDNAVELLLAANQYLLEDFKEPENVVMKNLTMDNLFDVLAMAHSYSQQQLIQFCITRMVTSLVKQTDTSVNLKSIKEKFQTLDEDLKTIILESSVFLNFALTSNEELEFISQWVHEVVSCTSEYSGWPATNVIGPSNTYPEYGDLRTAWAPKASRGCIEIIVLKYKRPVVVTSIDIYETYHPGAVVHIQGERKGDSTKHTLYKGEPHQASLPSMSRIFTPELQCVPTPVDIITITMDTNKSASWSELDAIQLKGYAIDGSQEQQTSDDAQKKQKKGIFSALFGSK